MENQLPVFFNIYFAFFSFLIGAVLGSFLNCVCIRIVAGENYVKGKSHCMTCGHDLGILDLVPIFSWLFLGGKCRYCKTKISPRYFLTELVMAVTFTITWLVFGLQIETPVCMILECLLLCAALCDWETKEIPDRFFLCITGLWLIRLIVESILNGMINWNYVISSALGGIAIPLVLFGISLILDKLLKKDTLGFGDVKLFAAIGLHLGLGRGVLNILLTCIIGLILVLVTKSKKKAMPLAPSIAMASTLTLLWGSLCVTLYTNLIF